MKSFLYPSEIEEIQNRLTMVRVDSARQWGKMTSHQMLCHLSDSYRMVMGEREADFVGNIFTTTFMKWLSLNMPMKWPPGIKTRPEADQEIGGTKPVEFAQDRQALVTLINRFTSEPRDFQFARHPIFGEMSLRDWMRWGYLHADHHLRQFNV